MAGARSLLSLLFLTLLVLFPAIFGNSSNLPHSKTESSPIQFLRHLQGCRKGQQVTGISNLKRYLERYGYLSNAHNGKNQSQSNEDEFDDLLESAVKTYQLIFNINVTGVLDADTVSQMMHSHRNSGSASFHTVSHYSFYTNMPRWSKFSLTYGYFPGTMGLQLVNISFVTAAKEWARRTRFTFVYNEDYNTSDIKIMFARGAHTSYCPPFTAEQLAHSSQPETGELHVNANQRWSFTRSDGYYNLPTLFLHELGHILGLGHSLVPQAIMFVGQRPGQVKGLQADDIIGIQELYKDLL